MEPDDDTRLQTRGGGSLKALVGPRSGLVALGLLLLFIDYAVVRTAHTLGDVLGLIGYLLLLVALCWWLAAIFRTGSKL